MTSLQIKASDSKMSISLPDWMPFIQSLGQRFQQGQYVRGVFASPDEYLVGFFAGLTELNQDDPTCQHMVSSLSGQLQVEYKCKANGCTHSAVSCVTDTYKWDIALDSPGIGLQDKIRQTSLWKSMEVGEEAGCDCGSRSLKDTRDFFKVQPRLLLVALKRYEYHLNNGARISNVSVPIELSINIDNLLPSLHVVAYKLSALVCQTDTHVWAFVRKGHIWYKCDDTNIMKVDISEAFTFWTQAFYIREA